MNIGAATGLPGGSAGIEIEVSDGKLQSGTSDSITHGGSINTPIGGLGIDVGKSKDGENSVKISWGWGADADVHVTLDREWVNLNDDHQPSSPFSVLSAFDTNSSSRDSSSFDHFNENSCSKGASPVSAHDSGDERGWSGV